MKDATPGPREKAVRQEPAQLDLFDDGDSQQLVTPERVRQILRGRFVDNEETSA